VTESTSREEEAARFSKERRYQHGRYLETRKTRLAHAKERWASDPEYRLRESERAKDKRAEARAASASERFSTSVAAVKAQAPKTRAPRIVTVDGHEVWVYSSGHLAVEVGRCPMTIREWLDDGVLPGATIRDGSGRYWFSSAFISACARAVIEVLRRDARGKRDILRRLMLDELERAKVSYVPLGAVAESARVRFARGTV